jgi:ethanolamine utilization protein EutP (predicted NTPase)
MVTSGGTDIIGEDIISSRRVRAGNLCNDINRYKISVLDTRPIISFFVSDTRTERTERSCIAVIASAAVCNRSKIAIFRCNIDETGIDKNDLALLSSVEINSVQWSLDYLKLYYNNCN